MRETTFISRNKDRWEEIEGNEKTNPDEVASDFIDLVNDLSYAQTHYPYSKITNYINFLASRVYKSIYFRNSQRKNPIFQFWQRDFPLILGHNRNVLFIATFFFLTFCTLGAICSFIDTNFIEGILGKGYVAMTETNIRNGKPFGVYESDNGMEMFTRIFANNFFVGLMLYLAGIFMGIGSFYLTFKNGIMVGAFLSMFFKHNLGFDAIFVIMLHGTLELMGLVLECMAGLILGLSFLFPHTLTRKEAFKKGLLESAKIFLGTVPFTFIAAFIESYVTYMGKGGFKESIWMIIFLGIVLVGSWVFVIWYFYIYPKKVAKMISYEEYLKETVKK